MIEHLSKNELPLVPLTEDGFLMSEAFVLIWHEDADEGVDEGLPLHKARTACLVAAEFLDLLSNGRIRLERKEKKKEKESDHTLKVLVQNTAPMNNYLDKLLTKIGEAKKPKSLKKWIFQLHTNSEFVEDILNHLTDRNILEKKTAKKMLGLREKNVYSLRDVATREAVRNRLRKAALDNAPANGSTLALLGIFLETDVLYSSLLPRLFAKEEVESATNRIKLRVGRKNLMSKSK